MMIEPCANCGSEDIDIDRRDWFVWHMTCNQCYDYYTDLGVCGFPAHISWPSTCKRDSSFKLINEWNDRQNESRDWHPKEDLSG